MRLAWAFFKRDAMVEMSYRTSFTVQVLGIFLFLAVFYYIGKTFAGQSIPALDKYGGSYLAFLLIGVALTDCVGVSLTTFAKQIREGQLTGALEATLMSPVSLPVILVYSSLWAYFFSAIRFVMYLALGVTFYKVSVGEANVPSAVAIFLLTVLCFAGIGMMWAGVVMIIKRGERIISLGGSVVVLVSGVLFPVSVLPGWVRVLGELVPLTHALDGMRLALLQGYGFQDLGMVFLKLTVFAAVLLPAGMGLFNAAVRIAKRTGSLVEY
ncbi:MAG: ABC transporter permease [Phycisphaerales bacterium]|nr:MAG: ABC transporter permease [Phycisphaerales bacterium]